MTRMACDNNLLAESLTGACPKFSGDRVDVDMDWICVLSTNHKMCS